jgi:hypothetical protein
MSRGALGAAALVVAAVGLSARRAQAQEEQDPRVALVAGFAQRTADLAVQQAWVVMSTAWRDVLTADVRKKLMSGLPTVVVARAYLFAERATDQPVVLSIKTCRIVFDLWDEVFRIDLREAGVRRQTVAVNVEGVLRRCGEARRLPIVALRTLRGADRHFLGLLVEVNPLSPQMLERIKRWVALPKGAGAVGPGDSLFGSFVGLFITHVPSADRTLMFRTQTFTPDALPVLPDPTPPAPSAPSP